jgi:Protein of unknown function (DUF3710)
VLRRRRRDGEDSTGLDEPGEADLAEASPASAGTAGAGNVGEGQADLDTASGGPWDISENYPPVERIDCGSLLIPVHEGFDVQINVAEEQGAWVAVVHDESGMQLQAFAAPRSGGLWEEVRHEISENISGSGGSSQETVGPFGPELAAQVPIGEDDQAAAPLQPVRFLGFNGPRWFLRGVISGPAATDPVLAAPFNALFSEVVVVRGDYPAPPREQLEIRLPEEARRALEEQMAEEDQPDWYLPDPFARGPEITETR